MSTQCSDKHLTNMKCSVNYRDVMGSNYDQIELKVHRASG